MEGQSPPLAIDLHRKSNAEHLVAYITTHHESFLALLPHRYKGTVLSGRVMLPGRGIPPDRHISRSLHTILPHPRWNTGREASEINRPRENSARATR
jgi:hypothetical protein